MGFNKILFLVWVQPSKEANVFDFAGFCSCRNQVKEQIDSYASEWVASLPTLECDGIIKLDYWRNVAIF